MAMNETLARYWLSLADLSSQTLMKVLLHYETALDFYEAREEAGPLLGAAWKTLKQWEDESRLAEALAMLEQKGIQFLTPDSAHWPRRLSSVADPPVGLYALGDTQNFNSPKTFAIVGTRHASVYGRRMAEIIANGLAEAGVTIISGFAVGIDTAAHEGCLKAQGKTVGILGCGLDIDYPSGSEHLRQRILASGGLFITEHPMGSRPHAGHFPQRNRLLAALAQGLMFVEGTTRSGGMISAHLAAEMGSDVFALPGSVESSLSSGPHAIIREGGRLAASAQEILEDMGWDAPQKKAPPKLSGEEAQLFKLLEKEPLSFDQLTHLTGWSPDVLNTQLTMLELQEMIQKSPGRVYSRTL